MVMSVGKARVHPVLKTVFDENQNILGPTKNEEIENEMSIADSKDDYKILSLVIFLIYETSLGKSSYWYPYLLQMPIVEISCIWPSETLKQTQYFSQIQNFRLQKDRILDLWKTLESIMEKYPLIFPPQFVDLGLFLTILGQIESRAFSIRNNSLIPMADNMNHSGKKDTATSDIIHK